MDPVAQLQETPWQAWRSKTARRAKSFSTSRGASSGREFFSLRIALDSNEYYWNLFVIHYNLQTQFNLFSGLKSAFRKHLAKGFPDYRKLIIPTAALLGFSALLLVSYILLFRRKPRGEKILRIFLRRLEKHGYRRRMGQGLEELVSEVPDEALRERAGMMRRWPSWRRPSAFPLRIMNCPGATCGNCNTACPIEKPNRFDRSTWFRTMI